MDLIIDCEAFLYTTLCSIWRGYMVNGQERWNVICLSRIEDIRRCEYTGWQFEPEAQVLQVLEWL